MNSGHPSRSGIALCLSGGGYRAALFHLGALRRLNERGILSRVDTVSSVSGGSILAAHLVDAVKSWPAPGTVLPDWDSTIAQPFKEFTSRNIRTGPLLERLLPTNWLRSGTAVEGLARRYLDLTRLRLVDMPLRPEFVFCATDLSYGVNWEFRRDRIGDYQAGYARPAADLALATAVAASSCFPPVFSPLRLGLPSADLKKGSARRGLERDRTVRRLGLSDGGVYDNMALEPVWKNAETVLVSDGGATFTFETDSGPMWRLRRYTSIVSRQARALRKRWLMAQLGSQIPYGAYWGIGGSGGRPGYSKELATGVVARIRTDLDCFSVAEQAVLENHGYLTAEYAINRRSWNFPDQAGNLVVPNARWMDEDLVRVALWGSDRRRHPFGRWPGRRRGHNSQRRS